MKYSIFIPNITLTFAALLLLSPPATAGNDEDKPDKRKERKENQEKEREKRKETWKAAQEALKAKDTNGDGSLSKEEYVAGESNADEAAKKFDKFNTNGDRVLSKSEFLESLGD